MRIITIALRLFIIMTLATGVVYPLLITAIGQLAMPARASGSIVSIAGRTIGSQLIGQKFEEAKYFWPRPSAVDYNPLPSGGSNLSWTSSELRQQVTKRREMLINSTAPSGDSIVPIDLLFSSGSGLDPHISPEAARFQISRILPARGLDAGHRNELIALVDSHTEPRDLGFLGEPRVDVLMLNLALDSLTASPEK
jgi:potassium-transporting ATPase KdpC subunit